MRIAILSRGPKLYSTRRLKEAAETRGYEARVLNPLSCSIEVAQGSPLLYYKNKKLSPYDAVIPRIGASITFFGTAVLRQFEQMGTFCVNPSHSITVSRDKLRALQVLSRHRIRIPTTLFVRHKSEILPGIARMGGPPVVVKLLEGTQGIGVILADSTKVAEAIIETLAGPAKMSVLLQKFVAESRGRDIRAFVVGNRVVAAMRRTASGDDFRSNIHRGGSAEVVELDEEYQRAAVHAAQIMGLRVAGVDLLEGKNGPVLMEVNSSPGLERLTLQSGYGVIEIPVDERSEFCGKTIRDSKLRERDVLVLTIQRESVTIPNPRVDREILAGDVLLCFGKTLTLKGLAPPRRAKTKKRRKAAPNPGADEPGPDA
jgi:ribosomal protein S6--L-glutamate ligase